jgi:SAM-dependent methyltransferase
MYRPDKTTKQEVRNSMKHQTPNYGNWIPKTMMQVLWGITGLTLATALAAVLIWKSRIISIFAFLLFLLMGGMTVYMQLCRRAFSFEGGGVMGQIHQYLLSKLSWNGKGRLLDIGCGSGALTIRCAKTWPDAAFTGIDYWGREWNYAREQCEENARLEQAGPICFLQGDASGLPFEAGHFDAAVSNFVFHEVKTQPDKRLVVREALRVVKKGGVFAFHDLFEQHAVYGDMQEFAEQLRREGISEVHYEPHTEQLSCIPAYVRAPWLLNGLGILYGKK